MDSIREYYYIPQIGDKYCWIIKPGLFFNPWECEKLRAIIYEIIDIKEGYIKFCAKGSYNKEVEPISKFKKRYTRIK